MIDRKVGGVTMKCAIKRTWWVLLAVLTLGVVWSTTAKADYRITNFNMQINVNKDGSADVDQSVTYDFDDDYHGVFLTQDLKGTRGAQLKQITLSNNGSRPVQVPVQNTGLNWSAKLTQTANLMKLKVFNRVEDGDRTKINYQYRINGVVTNYQDTAEINWKVIGQGWDVPLENVHIKLQLPGTNVKKLQAWSHGEADGYTTVSRKAGSVVMDVEENPANSFVETHMVFPTTLTPDNSKVVKHNQLAAIRKQENRLVQEENNAQQRFSLARIGAGVISLIVVLWMMVGSFKKRHHRHLKPTPIDHSFEVPQVSPAVAQRLLTGKLPDSKAVAAELMKLSAEGQLKLKMVQFGAKAKNETVEITAEKPTGMSFIDRCIKVVGNGTTVTIKEISNYDHHDRDNRVAKWFDQWRRSTNQEFKHYQDTNNVGFRRALERTGIVVLILMVVMMVFGGWSPTNPPVILLAFLIGLVLEIIIVVAILRTTSYNQAGLEQRNQIRGFKRMLKDIAHFNTAEIGDLILWEQILPYAVAFGLADQVAKKLKADFGEQLNPSVGFYPYYYGANLNYSLTHSISTTINHSVSASSSGSSGGFSGGSSGGFGGGSGGGAF
jgi:uncharacterized membrane protein